MSQPSMIYPVTFEDDGEGGIIASLPDIAGVYECGRTREEAKARVVGAAVAVIASLMDDGENVPLPSALEGREAVALPDDIAEAVRRDLTAPR